MGSFAEKKKELMEANKSSRKVFNKQAFNKLGTAMINDPDYTAKVVVTKNGVPETVEIHPSADFRKVAIGDLLKAAGHDATEQEKYVKEYQFGTLPLHELVSEMLTQQMSTDRPFAFVKKEDMNASIRIEPQAEVIKEVKSPQTGEVKKKKYSAYRKVKARSTCPANLKEDV